MHLPPRAHRLALWIASLAILFGTLAPAALQALSAAGGAWAEVCTASGARWIRVGDTAPSEKPAGAGHVLGHCPLCGLHTPTLGLPPAHESGLPSAAAGFAVPALFLAAPRPLFAWLSAQPRAPPVFC